VQTVLKVYIFAQMFKKNWRVSGWSHEVMHYFLTFPFLYE